MTKWIRWQGLVVFVVLTLAIAGFWVLLIDRIIERTIEIAGTSYNGAKVELESADLSIFPAGLKLNRIQVTNPDEPLVNAVEIDRLALSLDGVSLLRRKVIVEEMSIEGVQFDTPRERSGALSRGPSLIETVVNKTVCKDFEFDLPSFKIPDIKEILKNEEIEALNLVGSLQADIQDENGFWQTQLDQLPGPDEFSDYKSRIGKLASQKGGIKGLFGSAGEMKALQAEISEDLENIRKAQKEFDEKLSSLKERVEQVSKEPLKDIRRLADKYSLSPQGFEDLSQQLLSIRLCEWVQNSREWYERLKPVIERARAIQADGKRKEEEKGPEVVKPIRGKGVYVHFEEYQPLPNFLIRLANASGTVQFGDFAGKLENITLEQDVSGVPLTFTFSGKNLNGLRSVELSGELDHIDSSRSKDVANLQVEGYRLEDLILSESKGLPIVLSEGLADLSVDASLSGGAIEATIAAGFQSIKISTELGADSGQLAQAAVLSLSDIEELNVVADISGTFESYDIRVSSDLDRVLKNLMSKLVEAQTDRFAAELETAIMANLAGPMSDLTTSLGGFDAIGDELTDRLSEGAGILNPSGKKSGLPFGIKLPF